MNPLRLPMPPEFKAATKIIPDFMAALNSWEATEPAKRCAVKNRTNSCLHLFAGILSP
jgi:hypothetical protein